MKGTVLGIAIGIALTAVVANAQQPDRAATTAVAPQQAGPGCVVPEQAQQLIQTLQQRNDQLRDLSARIREMETQVAAAEAVRRELEASRSALRIAADRNRELREIGDAIIADYEGMDLGEKAAAGEPLTGLYRVRLENKLQEFSDQIAALGFYPERDAVPPAAHATSNP